MSDFKLGRNRQSPYDAKRLSITAVASTLPTPPASIAKGRFSLVSNLTYPMMANDRYGDCTVAAAGHIVQADTAYEDKLDYPSDSAVASEYLSLTGGADNGLALLDVLQPWQREGLWGHQLAAYAELPWGDTGVTAAQQTKLLKTSVWLTGSAYCAFWLPAGMQRNAYDWQTVGTGPAWRAGTWGGHCVPLVLYQSNGPAPLFWTVTWGKLVPVSVAFMRAYMDEAYCVVSKDWLNAKGKSPNGRSLVELAQLASQL